MQEKAPKKQVDISFDQLIIESREKLSDIHRRLDRKVFPLTNMRQQRVAHAIKAIELAQEILRDVDE